VNAGGYGKCAPGCKLGPRCGDGQVNGSEACDDGVNAGGYGKCAPGCKLGPYCGDGIKNGPEACDDGNRTSGDGCSATCQSETIK
jgi:cysteine-rich repeat protein